MSRWVYFLLLLGLVVGNMSVYRAIFAPPVLKVSVLEVGPPAGGGSAVLVQSPNGRTVLVDTGPDASILRALGQALPPWERAIGAIVLTGTKKSFVGGLPEVQNRYRVGELLYIGDRTTPYGTPLALDGSEINVIAPGTFTISYGSTSFSISSSTPTGVYTSDGKTVIKTR
ncbi:hypothetical protein HY415_02345 [Candidatus Kaiserbacteria bacterium]|nr:hypothetical protein [Candidatus Kaiserbacteria bacterium]